MEFGVVMRILTGLPNRGGDGGNHTPWRVVPPIQNRFSPIYGQLGPPLTNFFLCASRAVIYLLSYFLRNKAIFRSFDYQIAPLFCSSTQIKLIIIELCPHQTLVPPLGPPLFGGNLSKICRGTPVMVWRKSSLYKRENCTK